MVLSLSIAEVVAVIATAITSASIAIAIVDAMMIDDRPYL